MRDRASEGTHSSITRSDHKKTWLSVSPCYVQNIQELGVKSRSFSTFFVSLFTIIVLLCIHYQHRIYACSRDRAGKQLIGICRLVQLQPQHSYPSGYGGGLEIHCDIHTQVRIVLGAFSHPLSEYFLSKTPCSKPPSQFRTFQASNCDPTLSQPLPPTWNISLWHKEEVH